MATAFNETDLKILRQRLGARARIEGQAGSQGAAVRPAAVANVQLNVRVSAGTKSALQKHADRRGCSLATAVERAIENLIATDGGL